MKINTSIRIVTLLGFLLLQFFLLYCQKFNHTNPMDPDYNGAKIIKHTFTIDPASDQELSINDELELVFKNEFVDGTVDVTVEKIEDQSTLDLVGIQPVGSIYDIDVQANGQSIKRPVQVAFHLEPSEYNEDVSVIHYHHGSWRCLETLYDETRQVCLAETFDFSLNGLGKGSTPKFKGPYISPDIIITDGESIRSDSDSFVSILLELDENGTACGDVVIGLEFSSFGSGRREDLINIFNEYSDFDRRSTTVIKEETETYFEFTMKELAVWHSFVLEGSLLNEIYSEVMRFDRIQVRIGVMDEQNQKVIKTTQALILVKEIGVEIEGISPIGYSYSLKPELKWSYLYEDFDDLYEFDHFRIIVADYDKPFDFSILKNRVVDHQDRSFPPQKYPIEKELEEGKRYWWQVRLSTDYYDFDEESPNVASSPVYTFIAKGNNIPPTVNITSPADGATYTIGNTIPFEAVISDVDGSIQTVEFYQDGSLLQAQITQDQSLYSTPWNTAGLSEGLHRLKVVATDNAGAATEASRDVQLTAGKSITVTHPNGGEVWERNSSHVIQWQDNFTENVKIELYSGNNFYDLLTNGTASDGSFEWVIPSKIAPGNDYKIKISAYVSTQGGYTTVEDWSDLPFSIKDSPIDYHVVLPEGGTGSYRIGENVVIQVYAYDNDAEIQYVEFRLTETDGTQIYGRDGNPFTRRDTTPDSQNRYRLDWDTDDDTDLDEGTYRIIVTVQSTGGSGLQTTITIHLTSGDNADPVAYFTVTPVTGTTLTNFVFDAGDSRDNEDGADLDVRWDFDGDGVYDTNYSSQKTATHTYSSAGNYNAQLLVKDSQGATATHNENVVVESGSGGETSTMVGNDGKVYKTVKIGDQWWMAENLHESQYRDGSLVHKELTDKKLSTAACYAYLNNEEYANKYGYLYNWYAAVDPRNIAPEGWHVPSDLDWKILEISIGMSRGQADAKGGRGINEGGRLKEAGNEHWKEPNTGATDIYGFSALPAGQLSSNFWDEGKSAYFITSTERYDPNIGNYWDKNLAWGRRISYDSGKVFRSHYDFRYGKSNALSIRLVKDK